MGRFGWILGGGTARKSMKTLAPQVGLEPTTLRLTAECSTIELLRSKAGRFVLHYIRAVTPLSIMWLHIRMLLRRRRLHGRALLNVGARLDGHVIISIAIVRLRPHIAPV